MTEQLSPTRDIPAPRFEVIRQTEDTAETRQWLVKCHFQHPVRVLGLIEDGKVQPPQFGETEHVLVTQRNLLIEFDDEKRDFQETTVYASDEDGNFYNAALYVAPGIREIWEAMYAIGEI